MASPGSTFGRFLALAGVLAMALVAGCGGDDDEGAGPTTLNWFVAIQPGGTIEEVAARCSEESDGRYAIELELLPTEADQQREQLVRRLGAEDDSIDILGMDVIWTAEFANAGWILPWEGEEADRVTEDVFHSVIETASFEDDLYGAPFNSNTQVLFFRDDQVETPPDNWNDMIAEAVQQDGLIQVQANRYEGFVVWVNYLIASAGGEILTESGEVALPEEPTETALSVIGELARSPAAPPNLSTSTEDTARLGFEAGDSTFMLNYPFAYFSAEENAPDVFEGLGVAVLPQVVNDEPSAPPLGGFNLGVSAFSQNADLAFEAAACLANDDSQLTATELDGLPPTRQDLYQNQVVQDAYPGFADIIERSIENASPRPLTPAYTDVSLAIQRALHPPSKIDPENPTPVYEELREAVEEAVNREGLL